MTEINAFLTAHPSLTPEMQRQVTCLAAEAQIQGGMSGDALMVLEGVRSACPAHGAEWFRPALACLRVHLASDMPTARTYAEGIFQESIDRSAAFDNEVAGIAEVGIDGPTIPPRPLRPADVGERLGEHFLQEGELTHAGWFFEQALTQRSRSPRCVAFLGLARIALASGQPAEAFSHALTALSNGRYQQKTLDCWTLLAKSGAAGGGTFGPALLAGLAQATPALRAKAYQAAAVAAHRFGHDVMFASTRAWADSNVSAFPVETVEILKIAQARERKVGNPAVTATATQLMNAPRVAPGEFISAARHYLDATSPNLQATKLNSIASGVGTYLPATGRVRLNHGLGLVAKRLGNDVKAQALLTAAYGQSLAGSKGRRRAAWALAGMAEAVGDYPTAASFYQEIGLNAAAPGRFRNIAAVRWLKNSAATGGNVVDSPLFGYLQSFALAATNGPELLALARQTRSLGAPVAALRQTCLTRGLSLTEQAIQASTVPSARRMLVLQVVRSHRLEQRYQDILPLWDQHFAGAQSKDCDATYWEAAVNVFWSHVGRRQPATAELFNSQVMSAGDPGPEGWGWMGNATGTWRLIWQKSPALALAQFEFTRAAAPKHPHTVKALYWLALGELAGGTLESCSTRTVELFELLPKNIGFGWQENIRKKTINLQGLLANTSTITEAQAEASLDAALSIDLGRISLQP